MARDASVKDPPAGRTAQKRKAIFDAATTVFLRSGYLGASVDEIALLVLEGDAAGLAAKVAELSATRPAAQETGEAPAVRIVP